MVCSIRISINKRKNSMNFNNHVTVFFAYMTFYLIIGTKFVSRNSYLREVTCESHVECPQVFDPNSDNNYAIKDECVSILDKNGLKSIGVYGQSYFPNSDSLPRKCWTNGFRITTDDPSIVMRNVFIIMTMLIPLYVIIYMFIHRYKIKKNQDSLLEYYKSFFGEIWGLWPTASVLLLMGLIVILIYFFVMVLFLIPYHVTNQKVLCTDYKIKKINGVDTYVDSVMWKNEESSHDIYWNNGTNLLSSTSRQPAVLPMECWTDGASVSFYDPASLYMYSTFAFVGVIVVLILYWLIAKYVYYSITNHINFLETPPLDYTPIVSIL